MKLLLLQPPIQDFYDTEVRHQPFGLAYLKAAVKRHLPDIKVIIKDYHHGRGRKTVPVPEEFAYLKEYYSVPDKSPFSTFYHYYHFGADFETIAREVKLENPDLVGIASLFSPYYHEVLKCAGAIKAVLNAPIVLGGAHVSAESELMLRHPCVDFVIRGEGERPLVEFLKAFRKNGDYSGVPNLGYKVNGRPILNPTEENYAIDEIPIPDLSDFEPEHYLYEGKPMTFILTSRGCPYRCGFCSVHQTFGRGYRRRSVEGILSEIRLRYDQGYRVFDFEDDNLTFCREEAKILFRRLSELFQNGDVRFLAMNGVSYLGLDRELLLLMKEAGFTHLNLSLVSCDSNCHETVNRPHDAKKFEQTVSEAFEMGFEIVAYVILGLPQDDLGKMMASLIFLSRLPVLLGASPFYLTPGSPIAADFPELSESDIFRSRLTALAIETPGFSREDIYTLFIAVRILNFLKGIRFEAQSLPFSEVLRIADQRNNRSQLGAQILERLFAGKGWHAAVGNCFEKKPAFKPDLFFRLWNDLDFICTQEGKTVIIPRKVNRPDGRTGRGAEAIRDVVRRRPEIIGKVKIQKAVERLKSLGYVN